MARPVGEVPIGEAWPILEAIILHQRDSLQLAQLALFSLMLTDDERERVLWAMARIVQSVPTTLEDVVRVLDAQ
jgi:Trp operon repressor